MRILWLLFSALALFGLGPAAAGEAVPTPHVEAQLLSETDGVAPGQTVTIALRLNTEAGWHTYWKNSGDSGEPTSIEWQLPEGFTAGVLQFPAPETVRLGPYVTFAHTGDVWLLTDIAVPASATPGTIAKLGASAAWQVCSDICVPEEARFDLKLPVLKSAPPRVDALAEGFARARAALPQPASGSARFTFDGDTLVVAANGPDFIKPGDVRLYPEQNGVINNAAEQTTRARPDGLTLEVKGGAIARDATKAGALTRFAAVLVATKPGGRLAYALDLTRDDTIPREAPITKAPTGVGAALIFAFLGGALLNLMPCVFPVLSMKALALMRDSDARHARREGLVYSAGVVVSFLALAGVLIALRGAGEAVGWGFQLQSPVFVATLALVFVAVGLNLAGVYTIEGASVSGPTHPSLFADFLMGVLAVLVATPCTAPFMAAALGVALTLPTPAALLLFATLGAGMAAPYLLVTTVPAIRRLVPKPGRWMNVLREALAFPMFAAAAWLVWVLSREAGSNGVALAAIGIVLVGLAAWAWGLAARSSNALGWRIVAVLSFALALATLPPQRLATTQETSAAAHGEQYSRERLAALRTANAPVFVNATAAWCLICQANEISVLSKPSVTEAFDRHKVTVLKADWTRRDPEITALLEEHGRSGVPLYLVYLPGREALVLPPLLSERLVLDALDAK